MTFKALEPRKLPPSQRNGDVHSLLVLLTFSVVAFIVLLAEMLMGAPRREILGALVGFLGLIFVIFVLIGWLSRRPR